MNTNVKISGLVLIGLLLLGAANSIQGQGGPSGSYHLPVTDASSLIWDLSAVESLKHPTIDVVDEKKGAEAYMDFLASAELGVGGKISGAGQTTVHLQYSGEQGPQDLTFSATYKQSGSITSSKSVAKGSITVSVSGSGLMEGKTRVLKASGTTSFIIDNITKLVSGNIKSSASASGMGSISGRDTIEPESVVDSGVGDGGWVLNLSLTSAGKVVTGTLANVTLNSGRVLPFTVKGIYTAKTQSTKLVLTGTGVAKSSSLQVGIVGNEIKTVKGKVLGQFVGITR
jgi:hypothetical protein